jgi:acetyl esterase
VSERALDPEAAMFLAAINAQAGAGPQMWDVPIGEARATYAALAAMSGEAPPLASVEDGEAGGVRVRRYVPVDVDEAGVIVFFHGGGFTIGDLDSHDPIVRQLAARTRFPAVAVDYRMGPEAPFPAAVEDSLAAFDAVVDALPASTKVAVAGDSAGGNLAAVVAQQRRTRVAFQGLVYPVVDYTQRRPSYALNGEGHFLTTPTMDWFERCYVAEGTDRTDPRLSPILGDLAGLPPAWVLTCEFDPLRDEGQAYVAALVAAGGEVEHRHLPGSIHGVVLVGAVVPQGLAAIAELGDAIRAALTA